MFSIGFVIYLCVINSYWGIYNWVLGLIILGKCFCDLEFINWFKCFFSGRRVFEVFYEGI